VLRKWTRVQKVERSKKMEKVIEVKNLTKDYGQGRGVFDVSFYVNKGEVFGFLGPNGAGKSTTIRHLMGFSVPDSGETYINGHSSLYKRNITMRNVSYIPGEVALPLNLTGQEVIDEQKELKGVVDDTLLNWLIDIFEVDLSLLCKEMSLGMKRKLAIVSAFMSDPDIIIMDEPSSGLDPEMQEVFVELIKLEKRRGKTILLSSHIFEEVDAVCERIAVIKDGVIVSLLDANDLKHKSIKEYHISYKNIEDKNNAIIILKKNDFHVEQPFENENIVIVKCDETRTNEFLKVLPPSFIDFLEKKETLEDYFMSFYKEDKTYVGL
jgi:ABC-2 type transport system ATP-binding protein